MCVLGGGGGQKNRGFVTERRPTASKAYVTCYYTPRGMKYVGVYSFRFSICSFVRTFVRLFIRSFVFPSQGQSSAGRGYTCPTGHFV